MTDIGTLHRYRPDPSRIGRSETWRHAHACADITTDTVVVTVTGDVDASNAADLAGYLDLHTGVTARLFVDLRDVTFFSTAGLAVLRRAEHLAAQRGSSFSTLPGPVVHKVLRICGAQDLPQRETLDDGTASAQASLV